MEINEEVKNNNRWENEVYKKYQKKQKVLTYVDYKNVVEKELIILTKNTSDKIILFKNAKINGYKSQKNLETTLSIITLWVIVSDLCKTLNDLESYFLLSILCGIFLVEIIFFKFNTDQILRFEIINDLIQEYEEQIKKEEKYKNELVEFKKKYLSDLITTLKTTQKNIKDNIQEEIDSFEKDLKELDNT